MKNTISNKLYRAASFIELLVGGGVLVACVIGGLGIIATTDVGALFFTPDYFQSRLSAACYIIIGVEFIKMIACHTLDSVVDVMLLAIARQMITEHTSLMEDLIAVIAVGSLFVVRKYLYISQIDKTSREAARSRLFQNHEAPEEKPNAGSADEAPQ